MKRLLVGFLLMLLLATSGCANKNDDRVDKAPSAPTTKDSPVPARSSKEASAPFAASDACIFAPEEITEAFSWSEYVAGEAVPDVPESSDSAECSYPHAVESLQYKTIPFSVWVTGYRYTDPNLPHNEDLAATDRESFLARICPGSVSNGDFSGACHTLERGVKADIVLGAHAYSAYVISDGGVWSIEVSGSTGDDDGVDQRELDSLFSIAKLAADRAL